MRLAGLPGLITKKWKATTTRVPGVRGVEDLLDRNFAAGRRVLLGGVQAEPAVPMNLELARQLGFAARPGIDDEPIDWIRA
jgi:hypothetical protein